MTPVMLVAMAPLFVWLNVVREPTSNFATFVSLVPPATPMLMILRQSVPPGVPLWQPVLGIVLVLLCTLFFVFAGARIFRVGILMQGKAPKPSELAKWIVRG
jgi:ABC-2 type transport system permease protein